MIPSPVPEENLEGRRVFMRRRLDGVGHPNDGRTRQISSWEALLASGEFLLEGNLVLSILKSTA